MKSNEIQFIKDTARTIHYSVLFGALRRLELTEEELNVFDKGYRSLKKLISNYENASSHSKQHLWSFLLCYLDSFFEQGGFEDITDNEEEMALSAIHSCFIIQKESNEFSDIFLSYQDNWGVEISEVTSEGNTLH